MTPRQQLAEKLACDYSSSEVEQMCFLAGFRASDEGVAELVEALKEIAMKWASEHELAAYYESVATRALKRWEGKSS